MTHSGPQSHFLPYKAGWWPFARGDNEGRWSLACEPSCSCLLGALVVDQRDFSGSFFSNFECSGRQQRPNPAGILLLWGVPGTGGPVCHEGGPSPALQGVPAALSPPGRTAGPGATPWATGSDRPAGPVLAPVTTAAFLELMAGQDKLCVLLSHQGREKHHPNHPSPRATGSSRCYLVLPSAQSPGNTLPLSAWPQGRHSRDGLGQGPRGTGMWHWGQESGSGDRELALGTGMWHWEWEHGTWDGNVALEEAKWH